MDPDFSKTSGPPPVFARFLGAGMDKLARQVFLSVILLSSLFVVCWTSIACVRGYSSIPWWDEWGFVDQLQRGYVVSDLVASHAGHRAVVAYLLYLADLGLFRLSNAPFAILSWFIMLGILGLFIRLTFAALKKTDALIAMAFAAALVCSGFQMENLLTAPAMWHSLQCLFAVAAFVCLASGRVKLAIACGLLSAGTMAAGLWVCPVLLWQAWKLGLGRRQLVALALCGAASWGLYLWHWEPSIIGGMGYQAAAARPLDALTLAAMYFGGAIGYQSTTAGILSGWIAGFGAWRLIRGKLSGVNTAYAAVVLWVMMDAITTVVARLRIEEILPPNSTAPLPSHYMIVSLIGWAALVGLALSSSDRWARWPVLAAATFLAFALIPRQIDYSNWWVSYFRENERIGQKMVAGESLTGAEAAHLTDHPEDLPRLVGYMKERHLMCFAGKAGGSLQMDLPPTITSISPASPKSDQTLTVTVNGTNFQKGLRIALSKDTWRGGVPPEAVTYVSPTEVRAVMFLGKGGPYSLTLTVINPDGRSVSISFTVS
jgi:hypothetical protein